MSRLKYSSGGCLGITLLMFVAFIGCGSPAGTGKSPANTGKPLTNPSGLTAAVGNGTITYYRSEEGPLLMICSDVSGGSTGSSGSFSGPPWVSKSEGSVASQDGRKVNWSMERRGGKKTVLRLNDKDYDLEKGILFLVKTKGGPSEVEQLSKDLTSVNADLVSFKTFAQNDPKVGKLLELSEEAEKRE